MLQREHSAILFTFIKLPFVIKIFVLFIFEWLFYTGFTVHVYVFCLSYMYVFCLSYVLQLSVNFLYKYLYFLLQFKARKCEQFEVVKFYVKYSIKSY